MDKKTYETVISYIKSEILAGNLKQGKKLPPERELALQLGVSRTSVREALRSLEIMGLTDSIQGAGNYISGNFEKSIAEVLSLMFLLQQTDAAQLNLVRETLERQAVSLAAQHITEERKEALNEILAQMSQTHDEVEMTKLDKALHDTIALSSNNAILIQILSAMSVMVKEFIKDIRYSILQKNENQKRLYEIHAELVGAILARDGKTALAAFDKHSGIIKEHL